MKQPKIRTRMAPSPTGMLHIGGLRTALYNYLFAKQNDGEFLLRIEDTDRARFVPGAKEKIFEMLTWADLNWDGEPAIQSERLEVYQKYAQQLIDEDKAYYCFCTSEELEEMRASQQKNNLLVMYNRKCKELNEKHKDIVEKNLADGKPYVIRMKVPYYDTDKILGKDKERPVKFKDLVWGDLSFYRYAIDDQILIKSDGFPTYHFAVVVDDHEMEITHIMRGEEWLPSTPKHILLYQAFGWTPPVYCHLPNILGENKKKLSKRTGDVSVEDFKNKGYLPEALINYIALLGWNPGTEQEIFSLEELIKQFDVNKLHKSGAIFDYKKLDNINGQYLRKLPAKQLFDFCLPYLAEIYGDALQNYSDEYMTKVISLEQERLKKLSDIVGATQFFFSDILEYDAQLLIWKKANATETKKKLMETKKKLMEIKKWERDTLEKEMLSFIKEKNYTNGEVLWPLRVALSGQQNSPGPFEIMGVLGKKESLRRVESAIAMLC